MDEAKGLIITGIVTAVILIGGIFLVSKNGAPNKPAVANPALLIRSDSHQTNPSAKITIVEFGDYQCPACGQAFPITEQVLQNYGNKVNFVFRNFPLPQHKNAPMAAEA